MILVTDVSGDVAASIVRQLVTAGQRPRVLVREAAPGAARLAGFEPFVVPPGEPQRLIAACAGIERMVVAGDGGPAMLTWEAVLRRSAVAAGVRHVVRLSVMGADPRADVDLRRWHGVADREWAAAPMSVTVLRPAPLMQDLDRLVTGDRVITATGGGTTALVDAYDIAAVAVRALLRSEYEGGTYRLTGPRAVSYPEVVAVLADVTGSTLHHRPVTPEGLWWHLLAVGASPWLAGDLAALHTRIRDGLLAEVCPDIAWVLGRPARDIRDVAGDVAARLGLVRRGTPASQGHQRAVDIQG